MEKKRGQEIMFYVRESKTEGMQSTQKPGKSGQIIHFHLHYYL